MDLTRRNLLRTGWKFGGGLLAIAAGWTSWEMLRPLTGSGVKGKIKLGSPAKYKLGTATFVNQGRLWVANADGQYFALSPEVPTSRLSGTVLREFWSVRVSLPWIGL